MTVKRKVMTTATDSSVLLHVTTGALPAGGDVGTVAITIRTQQS